MRTRAVVLSCIAASTALVTVADAATVKKSCNLVVDKAGDINNDIIVEGQKAPVSFPASDSVDLVGGDLASDGKNITAVIKLAELDPSEQAVINRRYVFMFKPAGAKYPLLMAGLVDSLGETFNFGYYGPSGGATSTSTTPVYNYPGTATGVIEGNTIRITASLADMAAVENVGKVKPGAKITGLQVNSFRRYPYPSPSGATYRVSPADEATSKTAYVAGAKSCVKVG